MHLHQQPLKQRPVKKEGDMYERQAKQAKWLQDYGMSDDYILKNLGYDISQPTNK